MARQLGALVLAAEHRTDGGRSSSGSTAVNKWSASPKPVDAADDWEPLAKGPTAGSCELRHGSKMPAARVYLPISCFAFSAVIAVVSTVTTGSTEEAQSSRIFFDISIASLAPVG